MSGSQRDVLRQVHRLFVAGSLGALTDGELLGRFVTGRDETAFEALVERHGPMVLRVCRGVLGHGHDADDAFQATFIVLARRAGSLWVGDSLGTFLFGVARRAATQMQRAAARRARYEQSAAENGRRHLDEDINPERAEVAAVVVDEVQRLPGSYRSAVVLCYLEGLTCEEAAGRLGVSEGTVRGRLSRARDRLRPRLMRRGVGVPTVVALAAVSPRSAPAVPANLSDAVRAVAMEVVSGKTAVAGVIPTTATVLADYVLKEILMGVIKKVTTALLLVGCTFAAASGFQVKSADSQDSLPTLPRVPDDLGREPAVGSTGAAREPDEPALTTREVPRPWETTVRVKTHGTGTIGFGSGTVIRSTPGESLILTCAHIFRFDGERNAPPSRYPHRVTVDLFDGKLQDEFSAQVRFSESSIGEVVDYDFNRDVGLLRIRPGRKLPVSPIVPSSWQPGSGMEMVTAGCSEGKDATFWTTQILKSGTVTVFKNNICPFIECRYAPKQGRTGGGLFTPDGKLAGICSFAEPQANRGFYAAPASIYAILDRNGLSSLDTAIPVRTALQATGTPEEGKGPVFPDDLAFPVRPPVATPSLADHERRLKDVEQKLERLLRQREGAVESLPRKE